MNNPTSRTDPRILRTRQLIKDAVIELLQEMDIEKISVNRLAERATINRVTFYLHYRDIPDMLEKIADEMDQDIRQVMNDNSEGSILSDDDDFLLLVSLLKHIQEHAKFYKVILSSKQSTVFTDRLLKLITEMISARLERKKTDSNNDTENIQRDITIWYGSSALIGTIVAWVRKDMPYTPLFLAKQISMLRKDYRI